MLNLLEQRNREIWKGHPTILEDLTHSLGGIGLGLLLYPSTRKPFKAVGYSLVLAATAMHFYADMTRTSKAAGVVDRAKSRLGVAA